LSMKGNREMGSKSKSTAVLEPAESPDISEAAEEILEALEPEPEIQPTAPPAPAVGFRPPSVLRGAGGRPMLSERTRRITAVNAELARATAAVSAADASDDGPRQRQQTLIRRLNRFEGGDAYRADLVAAAVSEAGGHEALIAAIAPQQRRNVPSAGKAEQLRTIVRDYEIRLHSEELRAKKIIHPDVMQEMRDKMAEARAAIAAAQAKAADEQRREAGRVIGMATAGCVGSVAELSTAAAAAGLGDLARALAGMTAEALRAAGLEADLAEFPD
jgi:hypothetical protein